MATRSMPFWPRPATTSGSSWPGSGLCAPFSGRLSWSGITRAAPLPHPPEHANSLFHRRPDIGLEVVEPAPGAAGQPVGPLEAGDAGLDPGPEVAQPAIDPAAVDHIFDAEAALLVKGHVAHPACLRAVQVLAAGKPAVRRRLTRRRAVRADVALQHRHEPVTVGRVAGLDHHIEDQAAPAS